MRPLVARTPTRPGRHAFDPACPLHFRSPNPPQSFIATLPADKAKSLTDYVAMASRWSGMVSGPRALAARLAGQRGYEVRFVDFDGEDNGGVLPAALGRGTQFAFAQ